MFLAVSSWHDGRRGKIQLTLAGLISARTARWFFNDLARGYLKRGSNMGNCQREPFDRPEDVVLSLANAVVLLSKAIAEKDQCALGTLKQIHGRLAVILEDLNVSRNDSEWVKDLLAETQEMVSVLSVRH